MINPGVICLASLNHTENVKFPYRFEIEDNIGEAIHIHYKDIRIDLTVNEFERLAGAMEVLIDKIVSVEGFSCKDFDPVVLVGISGILANLQNVAVDEIYLEDIMVDTFDFEGNPIYASLPNSRVYKALNGIACENDAHKIQLNHMKSGAVEPMTNAERVFFNLQQIKKKGYPVGNDLIGIDENNRIWDGQHRAASLYFLYGNIKIPVRRMEYGETDEYKRNIRQVLWNEEYTLWLEERAQKKKKLKELQMAKSREIERNKVNSIKFKIRRIINYFIWSTWRKTDLDKDEYRMRFDEVKAQLNEIKEKLERKS